LRLGARGREPCSLTGPGWLHIIRPPIDPGPALPAHANLDRDFKAALDFPFDGVLAEWDWGNWCAPASPHIWEARVGPADGGYLTAQITVDQFPKCVSEGAPTAVFLDRMTTGVDGDIQPADVCRNNTMGRWLCQFATSVTVDLAHGGLQELLRTGEPSSYTCTANGNVAGYDYSGLCQDASAGDVRNGFPVALHGSEGGPRSGADLVAQFAPLLDPPAAPYLAAIGQPTGESGRPT
jgi:hypothetical protein